MVKRGQISIFIIIGVTILFIFMLISYLNLKTNKFDKIIISTEDIPIKNYIDSCLKLTGDEALVLLGIRGGYIELREPYLQLNNFSTNYLFYLGESLIPSKETIEDELSNYINKNLEKCVNFSIFDGVLLSGGEISTNAVISEENVIFVVQWPIIISKGEKQTQISKFTSQHNINLLKIINKAESIVEMEKYLNRFIDTIYLASLEINITFATYPNMTVVYRLIDDASEIDRTKYRFIFANKLKNESRGN
jgi:hypothetical protein